MPSTIAAPRRRFILVALALIVVIATITISQVTEAHKVGSQVQPHHDHDHQQERSHGHRHDHHDHNHNHNHNHEFAAHSHSRDHHHDHDHCHADHAQEHHTHDHTHDVDHHSHHHLHHHSEEIEQTDFSLHTRWILAFSCAAFISLVSFAGGFILFCHTTKRTSTSRRASSKKQKETPPPAPGKKVVDRKKEKNSDSDDEADSSSSSSSSNATAQNQSFFESNKGIISFLTALAVGSLLGDSLFHLFPTIFIPDHDHHHHQHSDEDDAHKHGGIGGIWFLLGFVLCLLLEVYLTQQEQDKSGEKKKKHGAAPKHHHHHHRHSHIKPFGWLNLAGDCIHNFIDGLGLGAAFISKGTRIGVAITVSMFFHELPQELSDFGVLVSAGFTPGRALFFNFFSGVTCVLGCALGGYFGTTHGDSIIAITAGSFIYIALVDMLPDLLKTTSEMGMRGFIILMSGFALGCGSMWGLSVYEDAIKDYVKMAVQQHLLVL